MHVWNAQHAARWKYRTQKFAKNLPSAHHRTNLPGYIVTTKACIDSQKKNLLNSNISSIRLNNMVNFGPLTAVIGWWVWAPKQISTGFASCLRYCTDVAQRRSHKLCTLFGRLLGWHTIYTLSGALAPLTQFCQLQNSLCVQVLHSPILVALLHSTPAKLCGTVQGMELQNFSLRASPMFGWAAITLGIGPHSSWWWIAI